MKSFVINLERQSEKYQDFLRLNAGAGLSFERFGASDADLAKITQWLQEQGLQVVSLARGRNWIAASGTAARPAARFPLLGLAPTAP